MLASRVQWDDAAGKGLAGSPSIGATRAAGYARGRSHWAGERETWAALPSLSAYF
jgi:hypothetical protein